MAKSVMADTQNALRTYAIWFGKVPNGRIAITEQPQFNFGQSWPNLVYLPVSAFLDATQRMTLMGSRAFRFSSFIDEVTPHEVAHQWWGHEVGWASYHDQWLSEGFADFSAALVMESTTKGNEVQSYWERQRKRILDRNEFGARANDAGPLWLGERLDWKKNESAYTGLTYSKGAYVLQMLRTMMWDPQTKDKGFVDMMHEFASSGGNASTESFAALAAKHMKPGMDLGQDKTLNWFFREWVYGTDIPRYSFEYSVKPAADGKFTLTGKLTQSEVSDGFVMAIPLYVENPNKQLVRLGLVTMAGNNSHTFTIPLPFKPARVAMNALHEVLATDTVNKEVQ
jgi:aminopeptidase N